MGCRCWFPSIRIPLPVWVQQLDADDIFAYRAVRTVKIRDRWLGLLSLFLKVCIVIYIGLYSILLQQKYRAETAVVGSARMQFVAPENKYRWPDQRAPYCLGSNNTGFANDYVFPSPGMYMLNPDKYGGAAVPEVQLPCVYVDGVDEIPDPLDSGAAVVPTRVNTSLEIISPLPACMSLEHSYCTWQQQWMNVSYMADIEMFTVFMDASFTGSTGKGRNILNLRGYLLDSNGDVLDPCDAYKDVGTGSCPSYISVGQSGKRDIFTVKTLFQAAGLVHGLDSVAGSAAAGLDDQTRRFAGTVLTIQIFFTNYMLPAAVPPTLLGTGAISEDEIIYYYRVSAATDTYYKAMSATSPTGLSPYFQRYKLDRHALRVNALISGKIGYFAVGSLLVTLTVSLGLMSVAVLVTDMCMTQCCRLRHIYRQYQERWTPDFSDLREALDDGILTKFRNDQFLVDPVPPVLSNAMVQHQSRVYQRGTRAGGAYDVEGALKGGPGSAPLLAGLDEEGSDDSASVMDGRSATGGGGVSVTGGSGRLITVAITGRPSALPSSPGGGPTTGFGAASEQQGSGASGISLRPMRVSAMGGGSVVTAASTGVSATSRPMPPPRPLPSGGDGFVPGGTFPPSGY